MAFGFPPKYSVYFSLDPLTTEQFLVLALEAAGQQGWNVGYIRETRFFAYTQMPMGAHGEEIKVVLDNGIATIQSACIGNQILDRGENKRNVEAFLAAYDEAKAALSPEELAQKQEALKMELVSRDAGTLTVPSSTREDMPGFLFYFIPRRGYFITPILVNLNILVFILMVVSGVSLWEPDSDSLIRWGAQFKPLTLDGEWWRLLTSCFVHIGLIHLLMNMYALLYIGLMLEPYLGKLRFAAAYLLTGIAASLISLWWHDLTVGAGASGAIFGMYGVFFAMLTTNLIEKKARKQLLTSIGIFISYNLLNGMKGGIDNAAHIGGLMSGLIAGYLLYPSLKRPEQTKLQYSSVALFTVLVMSATVIMCKALPNDIAQYEKRMHDFASLEAEALSIYQLPQDTPKEKQLSAIQEKGIQNWNKCIQLITDADKLDLPKVVHQKDKILLRYCELRLKFCELAFKSTQENTSAYNDQLKGYNKEIEATIASLKLQ